MVVEFTITCAISRCQH